MGIKKEDVPMTAEKSTGIEGYQSFYQDAAGHNQFEIIPIEHRISYIKAFENTVPTEEEYNKWKASNNVQILKTVGDRNNIEGYKFTDVVGKEIYDYLNGRPMVEVEDMIFQMFENPNDPNPFISKEGIQTLTKYLQEKCPRIEAKRLIELLANDGLEKYILKPIDKPASEGVVDINAPE